MDRDERRLRIAVGAAAAEVLAQVGLLVARGAIGGAALRPLFLLAKLPLFWWAWKRHPGGYLGVWLWEIGAVIAALSVRGALAPRAVIAVGAIVVMVLLGRAISAYPTVEWRAR